jgi:DNA-binding response OmpR family regulator
MNYKVLLADDSLTIQKVIKITLANQPYDIVESSSEDDLFKKLPLLRPQLILLDFNLSEKYTGYELSSKIKSICPEAKILLLLGTFDSVDELSMQKCGASDKIVKPFDSNKFIAICKNLIDSLQSSFMNDELPYPEQQNPGPTKSIPLSTSSEDQWEVGHTTERIPEKITPEPQTASPKLGNPLLKEVSDWGMSIPSVINNDTDTDELPDLPPIIGEGHKNTPSIRPERIETKYPTNEDLDYPTIEELAQTSAPIDLNLSQNDFGGLELEPHSVSFDNVKIIQEQIHDEIEKDLWIADEFEDIKKEVATKIENIKNNFQPTLNDFDESLFSPIDDSSSLTMNDVLETPSLKVETTLTTEKMVNLDEMRKEIDDLVKKHVKNYMDQLFLHQTEKVAWEVIPDLAENLIRQEISKISSKIMNDQN